jgi:hypothetical protein
MTDPPLRIYLLFVRPNNEAIFSTAPVNRQNNSAVCRVGLHPAVRWPIDVFHYYQAKAIIKQKPSPSKIWERVP